MAILNVKIARSEVSSPYPMVTTMMNKNRE